MGIAHKALGLLAFTTTLVGASLPAFALTEVLQNDQVDLSVGGRLQVLGFAEFLNDPVRNGSRIYLFGKTARLEANVRRGDYSLYTQLALGGEDVFTTNTDLSLLDMYATGPVLGLATWRVGQFKVPYGRELLTDSGHLSFNDRSLVSPFFLMGRDVGASLEGKLGPATVIVGVFTGGGRDVPQRYLPEILGIPLLVARATVGDADTDPYRLDQHDFLDTETTRKSLSASAVFTRDSRVGHSTVLNIKDSFDKSLLLDGSWNPYIGEKDPATGEVPQGQYWQAGLDGVLKKPWQDGTLSGEAELNYGNFANSLGGVNAFGGRVQGAYYRKPFEVALRYAVLVPSPFFAVTNTTAGSPNLGQTTAILPDGAPIHELTPAISYFLDGDRLKFTLDAPITFGDPIVTEAGIGSYNLVNEPDQTSVLTTATNTLTRQLVLQLRGSMTYAF